MTDNKHEVVYVPVMSNLCILTNIYYRTSDIIGLASIFGTRNHHKKARLL
ncbi:hypothetical protein H8S33_16655 [Ornithinibacillus sp. BX22]|uniref:Uncharacterized protein n=2 Tax=Ornithinibacillus TaxID=484508 RepID=A0A923L8N9_9BACI|nr:MULTISPECIES: hypothetical protein [Ornithinibacillus]MBC5638410.1 hypothetical protein [Ornithinibacillus hominis]MBS3678616.1 hypothetical protein [Ornithinibacillus massiliensis]